MNNIFTIFLFGYITAMITVLVGTWLEETETKKIKAENRRKALENDRKAYEALIAKQNRAWSRPVRRDDYVRNDIGTTQDDIQIIRGTRFR